MVKFYVRRILVDKKMTIDDVPERWRKQVRAEIEKQNKAEQEHGAHLALLFRAGKRVGYG